MPVSVEVDNTPDGIDGELVLGNIPFEKTGDVYEINFEIGLTYSTSKANYQELLARLMLLSQKLCRDTHHTFGGWVKEEDSSKIIYNGLVTIKGRINPDLLV